MPEENDNDNTEETRVKPTITIAELDDSDDDNDDDSGENTRAKPTITIAERDGGE